MADETRTRAETMADDFDAAVAQYGADNLKKIMLVVLKDISVSLGMIADNTTPSTTTTSETTTTSD